MKARDTASSTTAGVTSRQTRTFLTLAPGEPAERPPRIPAEDQDLVPPHLRLLAVFVDDRVHHGERVVLEVGIAQGRVRAVPLDQPGDVLDVVKPGHGEEQRLVAVF